MKSDKCPRCYAPDITKVADSPVQGKFEVYSCSACNYMWRSTEDLSGISHMIDEWRKSVNTTLVEH